MATSRVVIKCFIRHLGRDASVWKGRSPGLQAVVFDGRHFRSDVQDHQQSELNDDSPPPPRAPSFQPISLPLRNYSPVVAGFSVLPNPAVGVPTGLSPPTESGVPSSEQLGRDMSNCLALGRLEECVKRFEDWVKLPDLQGKAKVPSVMAYNLLLNAKLRQGVDPRNMEQIITEMKMNRLKPNLLSYNCLLRAIFRQRDSKMAEETLVRMEQSGPEAQPDGDSYNFVVVLCALDRRIDAAVLRLQAMLSRGFVPSKTTYNELLYAATRERRTSVAASLLKDMQKLQITPQPQSVIELAVTSAAVDDSECALLALKLLSNSGPKRLFKPLNMDEGGMFYLLSSAARSADVPLSNEAWSILCNTLKGIKAPSPASYLSRLHCLATAGDFDTAFATLRELETLYGSSQKGADREIFSPFSSLRPLVLACTQGGFAALDAAFYKLVEMHSSGQPVTLSAINCVIQGCANAWDFDRAYQTFETIVTTFGLMPDVHSCNSLLDVFGKSRKISEVVQIFNYMHEVGIIPDERTYSLLIAAHVVNRDEKAAIYCLKDMKAAGYVPQRQTLAQIWRRCMKQGNKVGAIEMEQTMKELGYRDTIATVEKWIQIGTT